MSIVTSVSGAIATSRGVACGSAPCSAEATIESNDGPGRPAQAHLVLERDRDLALRAPDQPELQQPAVDLVHQRGGGADAQHLPRLLDGAHGLDDPRRRDELDPVGQQLAEAPVRRTDICASSKPSRVMPSRPESAPSSSCGPCSRSKSGTSALACST